MTMPTHQQTNGHHQEAEEKRPETEEAILICENTCERPTPHEFAGRRQIKMRGGGRALYDEIVYHCLFCGARRVWGTEEISTHTENQP